MLGEYGFNVPGCMNISGLLGCLSCSHFSSSTISFDSGACKRLSMATALRMGQLTKEA